MTQTVLLGDICDVRDGTHDSPKPKDTGHPLVTSKHIKNYKIDFSTANLISDEDFDTVNKRSKVDKHDILISMIGTVGELALIDYEPTFAIKNIGLIKTRDELLGKYLFYYLQSAKAKQYIEASLAGSTQKFIGLGQLRKFPVELPDLETQKEIADILGTIDEKIELNRRMNETLEQMGQALFRHYFIDNPEAEKWEKKLLGDFVELVNGASYKSAELKPSSNALVTLKSIGRGGGFSRRGYKEFTGKMKDTQIVRDGDLIVAHTDLTQKAEVAGYPALVDGADQYDQVAISMDLVKVVPRSKELSSSVVYFLLKTREFQDYKMGYISGSTVLHLNKKCIPSYEMSLPSDAVALQAISSEFDDLMEKIKNNNQQIQTLTTLRDTLLPRLINGKVKI